MAKQNGFQKVRCLNMSGKKERVVYIPYNLTKDQAFMTRNQLVEKPEIKLEEIGKVVKPEVIEEASEIEQFNEPEQSKRGRPKK